jgi:undecaprenyl-diphosphatase
MTAYQKYRHFLMIVFFGVVLVAVSSAVPTAPADEQQKQLTTTQAVILGIVEGLTEYLPISSTGHLLVTKDLLGMGTAGADMARQATETNAINAYLVCIQFGAILAILFVCANRFKKILKGLFQGDADGRRLLANLILALLPAVVIGLILEDSIKKYLFGTYPVIAAWFVGPEGGHLHRCCPVPGHVARRQSQSGNHPGRLVSGAFHEGNGGIQLSAGCRHIDCCFGL